jgi:integrase
MIQRRCRTFNMMIRVAVCTGIRVSEILGLRWDDIDFHNSVIAIRRSVDGKHEGETKSEDSHTEDYPMHGVLSEALKAWKQHAEYVPVNGWVFGSALTGRPFHASTMQADHLKPAGERAGIKGLGWHTFRHTYRALLADLEEPLEVQQALMRHSDISMTVEYGKFGAKRAAQLREANAKVVKMVSGL